MSVTDQDRAKAIEVLDGEGLMPSSPGTIDAIATALAAEREQARTPFRELLDELDGWRDNALRYAETFAQDAADEAKSRARHAAYKRATDGIRHALQDQP